MDYVDYVTGGQEIKIVEFTLFSSYFAPLVNISLVSSLSAIFFYLCQDNKDSSRDTGRGSSFDLGCHIRITAIVVKPGFYFPTRPRFLR